MWLMILKLLRKKTMSGMEIKRALTSKGFNMPHKTTLYTTLKMLETMKMIESTKRVVTERGKEEPYRVTEKGIKILSRAIQQLKNRPKLLAEMIWNFSQKRGKVPLKVVNRNIYIIKY